MRASRATNVSVTRDRRIRDGAAVWLHPFAATDRVGVRVLRVTDSPPVTSHPPHDDAVALGLWLVPSTPTGTHTPERLSMPGVHARRPAIAGVLGDDVRASRPSGLCELAGLVHDDLSVGDLRRIRKGGLDLLLAHPVGRDAGRLLRVCGVSKKPTERMTPLPASIR